MTIIDVIILSYAKDECLKALTQQTIDTLIISEDPNKISFNILVIESNRAIEPLQFSGSTTIYPKKKFGFNKFLNIGIKATNNPIVCLCNNDLFFNKGWASEILKAMDSNPEILSASPICPIWHKKYPEINNIDLLFGYEAQKEIAGWCILLKREILSKIGNFDEKILFWFSDNDYGKNLEKHKIKHALVTASKVKHLDSKTINSNKMSEHRRIALTYKQLLYFEYKWKHQNKILYFKQFISFDYLNYKRCFIKNLRTFIITILPPSVIHCIKKLKTF